MSKFTEEKLELAFIELLENQGITYTFGKDIVRNSNEVYNTPKCQDNFF
ncbi:hypothetical protein [Aliarcobacter cryaerophilus]|nr:hypothetical protein [Aliarcobacter cryaerophilus]